MVLFNIKVVSFLRNKFMPLDKGVPVLPSTMHYIEKTPAVEALVQKYSELFAYKSDLGVLVILRPMTDKHVAEMQKDGSIRFVESEKHQVFDFIGNIADISSDDFRAITKAVYELYRSSSNLTARAVLRYQQEQILQQQINNAPVYRSNQDNFKVYVEQLKNIGCLKSGAADTARSIDHRDPEKVRELYDSLVKASSPTLGALVFQLLLEGEESWPEIEKALQFYQHIMLQNVVLGAEQRTGTELKDAIFSELLTVNRDFRWETSNFDLVGETTQRDWSRYDQNTETLRGLFNNYYLAASDPNAKQAYCKPLTMIHHLILTEIGFNNEMATGLFFDGDKWGFHVWGIDSASGQRIENTLNDRRVSPGEGSYNELEKVDAFSMAILSRLDRVTIEQSQLLDVLLNKKEKSISAQWGKFDTLRRSILQWLPICMEHATFAVKSDELYMSYFFLIHLKERFSFTPAQQKAIDELSFVILATYIQCMDKLLNHVEATTNKDYGGVAFISGHKNLPALKQSLENLRLSMDPLRIAELVAAYAALPDIVRKFLGLLESLEKPIGAKLSATSRRSPRVQPVSKDTGHSNRDNKQEMPDKVEVSEQEN